MSFYSNIDKAATVKKVKVVLDEYSKFIKIVNSSCFDINVKSRSGIAPMFSSTYVNSDAKLIKAIENKDRNYADLNTYINGIQNSINNLELWEIELINMRYIHCLNVAGIKKQLKSKNIECSDRQIYRKFETIYLDFAIHHGIYVIKKKKS